MLINDLGEGMKSVCVTDATLVLSREEGMMGKGCCADGNPGGANPPSQPDPIRAIREVWSGSFERHS